MNVSIYKKQNDEELLVCLVAQRRKYTKCKKFMLWGSVITMIMSLLITIASFIVNNNLISIIIIIINVLIFFTSSILYNYIEDQQEQAAKLQQYFDVSCFNHVVQRNVVSIDSIITLSDFENEIYNITDVKEIEDVRNWYSDYSKLHPYKQIFYSQLENFRWDYDLRQFYKNKIFIWFFIFCLIPLIAWILIKPNLTGFINALTCIGIIGTPFINNMLKLKQDIKRLYNLKQYMNYNEKNLDIFIEKSDYTKLQDIQDRIFENRKKCCLIPDRVYNRLKVEYQHKQVFLANRIVKKEECSLK